MNGIFGNNIVSAIWNVYILFGNEMNKQFKCTQRNFKSARNIKMLWKEFVIFDESQIIKNEAMTQIVTKICIFAEICVIFLMTVHDWCFNFCIYEKRWNKIKCVMFGCETNFM